MRVGLVGLGRFGKLHAAVLNRLPGVELAAICDPNPAELAALGDRYGVAGRYAAFDELLARETLDALFIVSPEPLHAEQALAAFGRGLPVFLEKPLALTYDEGKRVAAAAEAAGVPLQLGFLLRFEVQHALLKQEIAAGRFGELVSLRMKRNISKDWFPVYGDRAHPVYEASIHDIDLVLWYVASPCTSVYAVERNVSGLRYPDACFALARFANGATAFFETSWLVPAGAPANVLTPTWHGTIDAELEVVGTERSARIRLLDTGLAIWQPDLTAVPDAGMWPEVNGQIAGALREEVAHFLDRVKTGRPSAIASVADALAGLQLAEAIVTSAASGQEVKLPAIR